MEGNGSRLAISFGENIVVILCDDPVRRRLSALLRHCLASEAPSSQHAPSLTLLVDGEDGAYRRLLKDGEEICANLSLDDLTERLVYEVTLGMAVRSQKQLVLHAAGLASGENGLILCGESGSGKSTLATWLTAKAYDFLSDELVSVSLDGGTMRGFPRPIALKSSAGSPGPDWLHPLISRPAGAFQNGTVYMDPEQLRSGSVRETARPQVLLFPKYSAGAGPALRPLSRAEAAFRLMHLLLNAASFPDRGFAAVTRFAGNIAAYSLSYADAALAAACVEEALSRPSK